MFTGKGGSGAANTYAVTALTRKAAEITLRVLGGTLLHMRI
jgi:hypothetical protein